MKENLLIGSELIELHELAKILKIDNDSCASCRQLCNRSFQWRWLHPTENYLFNENIIEKNGIAFFNSGICKHLDGKNCGIYKNRPLECRLSPISVINKKGIDYWILDKKCNIILIDSHKIKVFHHLVEKFERQVPQEFIHFLKKVSVAIEIDSDNYIIIKKLDR